MLAQPKDCITGQFQQLLQSYGECSWVKGVHQNSPCTSIQDLCGSTVIWPDGEDTSGGGFNEDHAEGFVRGQQREGISERPHRLQFRIRKESVEMSGVTQSQIFRKCY